MELQVGSPYENYSADRVVCIIPLENGRLDDMDAEFVSRRVPQLYKEYENHLMQNIVGEPCSRDFEYHDSCISLFILSRFVNFESPVDIDWGVLSTSISLAVAYAMTHNKKIALRSGGGARQLTDWGQHFQALCVNSDWARLPCCELWVPADIFAPRSSKR